MGDVVSINQGFMATDGELQHGFKSAWGAYIWSSGKRAHYFQIHPHGYKQLCTGQVLPAFIGNGQCAIFGPGNYPRCKRCSQKLNARQ